MTKQVFKTAALFGSMVLASATATAGIHTDRNGNIGYDTLRECNMAVTNGTAKFYRSHTKHRPKRRRGEVRVRKMRLAQLNPQYQMGACDRGVGRRLGRDGVARALQGKYIPYSPNMLVNVYSDRSGTPVRVSMAQCDNWFSANFPNAVKPYRVSRPAPRPVVRPKPVMPKPVPKPAEIFVPEVPSAPVAVAAAPTGGGLNFLPILGAVAVAGAIAINASKDNKAGCTSGCSSK